MFRLLTFLGTSSGTPTPYRNVSSACLTLSDGRVWMVDCGEGTQHQLLRCKDVSVSKVEKVFLTHLHGDHCYGLPGMLCSMSLLWSAPGVVPNATFAVQRRALLDASKKGGNEGSSAAGGEEAEEEPTTDDGPFVFDHFSKTAEFLEIYGPQGTAAFLREVLRSSETRFGFRYRVTEMMHTPKPPPCASTSSNKAECEEESTNANNTANTANTPTEKYLRVVTPPPYSPQPAAADKGGEQLLECEAAVRRLYPPSTAASVSSSSSTSAPSASSHANDESRNSPTIRRQHEEKEEEEEGKEEGRRSVFDGYCYHFPAAEIDPVGGVSLRAAWLDHPVPSLGFTFTEADAPGTLDVAKAAALGVPKGPLLAKLKGGEAVTFAVGGGAAGGGPSKTKCSKKSADGSSADSKTAAEEEPTMRTVHPSEVVGPAIKGRKLTMLGDTSNSARMAIPLLLPNKNNKNDTQSTADTQQSDPIIAAAAEEEEGKGIAANSDWLVHEATFDEKSSHLAIPRGHSTAAMAGRFARSVAAKKLIITHFSARYPPTVKDPEPIEQLRREAVGGLSGDGDVSTNNDNNNNNSRDADVVAAEDFLTIDLSRAARGALKKHAL